MTDKPASQPSRLRSWFSSKSTSTVSDAAVPIAPLSSSSAARLVSPRHVHTSGSSSTPLTTRSTNSDPPAVGSHGSLSPVASPRSDMRSVRSASTNSVDRYTSMPSLFAEQPTHTSHESVLGNLSRSPRPMQSNTVLSARGARSASFGIAVSSPARIGSAELPKTLGTSPREGRLLSHQISECLSDNTSFLKELQGTSPASTSNTSVIPVPISTTYDDTPHKLAKRERVRRELEQRRQIARYIPPSLEGPAAVDLSLSMSISVSRNDIFSSVAAVAKTDVNEDCRPRDFVDIPLTPVTRLFELFLIMGGIPSDDTPTAGAASVDSVISPHLLFAYPNTSDLADLQAGLPTFVFPTRVPVKSVIKTESRSAIQEITYSSINNILLSYECCYITTMTSQMSTHVLPRMYYVICIRHRSWLHDRSSLEVYGTVTDRKRFVPAGNAYGPKPPAPATKQAPADPSIPQQAPPPPPPKAWTRQTVTQEYTQDRVYAIVTSFPMFDFFIRFLAHFIELEHVAQQTRKTVGVVEVGGCIVDRDSPLVFVNSTDYYFPHTEHDIRIGADLYGALDQLYSKHINTNTNTTINAIRCGIVDLPMVRIPTMDIHTEWGLTSSTCMLPCLQRISVNNLVSIFEYLLTNTSVIVASQKPGIVSSIVMALSVILKPFRWAGLCISLVPAHLDEYLDAPGQGIFGIIIRPTLRNVPEQHVQGLINAQKRLDYVKNITGATSSSGRRGRTFTAPSVPSSAASAARQKTETAIPLPSREQRQKTHRPTADPANDRIEYILMYPAQDEDTCAIFANRMNKVVVNADRPTDQLHVPDDIRNTYNNEGLKLPFRALLIRELNARASTLHKDYLVELGKSTMADDPAQNINRKPIFTPSPYDSNIILQVMFEFQYYMHFVIMDLRAQIQKRCGWDMFEPEAGSRHGSRVGTSSSSSSTLQSGTCNRVLSSRDMEATLLPFVMPQHQSFLRQLLQSANLQHYVDTVRATGVLNFAFTSTDSSKYLNKTIFIE